MPDCFVCQRIFAKILNIFRVFLRFSTLRRIFDTQYQSKCKLSNKIEFNKKLFPCNIDFNLCIMYNRIEELFARVCVHKEEI